MPSDHGKHHLPAMTRRLTISEKNGACDDTEPVLRLCCVRIVINCWTFHMHATISGQALLGSMLLTFSSTSAPPSPQSRSFEGPLISWKAPARMTLIIRVTIGRDLLSLSSQFVRTSDSLDVSIGGLERCFVDWNTCPCRPQNAAAC